MNMQFILVFFTTLFIVSGSYAQNQNSNKNNLYIDVHYLPDGKVKYEDVAAAHVKDLATESKYSVQFIKYWVDESKGIVYCLSSAPDTSAITNTHREAHGLIPQTIYKVEDGAEAISDKNKTFFLDI